VKQYKEEITMSIKLGQMRQVGYVVKDIEQAMKQWI
jgi:hypothetical protein